MGTFGDHLASGCTCGAGTSGTIVATQVAPFYHGACSPVLCPENTTGVDLKRGCRCGKGYHGVVEAIAQAPYFRPGIKEFVPMLA